MGVPFFGYHFPLWVPIVCGGYGIPDSQSSVVAVGPWLPAKCGTHGIPGSKQFWDPTKCCGSEDPVVQVVPESQRKKKKKWAKRICWEMQLEELSESSQEAESLEMGVGYKKDSYW